MASPDRTLPPATGPSWPVLAGLILLVLTAHVLVLRTRTHHVGEMREQPSQRTAAFSTRTIAPPPLPPPPPTGAAVPKPAAPAKPALKPVVKKKQPVAQAPRTSSAIDSIAEPLQAQRDFDPSTGPSAQGDAPAESPSAPEASGPAPESIDTATAPAPAASAAPATQPPVPPIAQTVASPVTLPPSAQLTYKMTGSAKGANYFATGELFWHNDGSRYDARMSVSVLFIGARSMRSTGQISPQGLAPSRFSDKARTEVAAHFEPDKGQISFSANTPPVPWTPGTQDRVSIFMQLGGMLAANPGGFPVGSTFSMMTVGPRDADNWTFVVENEEKISLPLGELATIKLSRKPRREFDQKVEIWYAPQLGYLPVRNKITQANGDFVDQQISGLTRP